MNSLGDKIKQRRKELGMSQTNLADNVGISYAQIGRYETKGAQPPAEVLKKIADALEVSLDYLINGNTEEKIKNSITDAELIRQFKSVEQMEDEDKKVIKTLIDAFITKRQIQKLAV